MCSLWPTTTGSETATSVLAGSAGTVGTSFIGAGTTVSLLFTGDVNGCSVGIELVVESGSEAGATGVAAAGVSDEAAGWTTATGSGVAASVGAVGVTSGAEAGGGSTTVAAGVPSTPETLVDGSKFELSAPAELTAGLSVFASVVGCGGDPAVEGTCGSALFCSSIRITILCFVVESSFLCFFAYKYAC